VRRAVLYAEDTVEARRIAGELEEDPDWELVALCSTVADLDSVLDHVRVDLLLWLCTSDAGVGVLRAVWSRLQRDHLPVWFRSSDQPGESGPTWRTWGHYGN
jgi:hypothetical protein